MGRFGVNSPMDEDYLLERGEGAEGVGLTLKMRKPPFWPKLVRNHRFFAGFIIINLQPTVDLVEPQPRIWASFGFREGIAKGLGCQGFRRTLTANLGFPRGEEYIYNSKSVYF